MKSRKSMFFGALFLAFNLVQINDDGPQGGSPQPATILDPSLDEVELDATGENHEGATDELTEEEKAMLADDPNADEPPTTINATDATNTAAVAEPTTDAPMSAEGADDNDE